MVWWLLTKRCFTARHKSKDQTVACGKKKKCKIFNFEKVIDDQPKPCRAGEKLKREEGIITLNECALTKNSKK